MEKGVQRWVVDISKWNPSINDFSFALSLLPQHHHSSITRSVAFDHITRKITDLSSRKRVPSSRLKECGRVCFDFPNFNFNVSHHGDYVAIASEPLCLVGLDIAYHMVPKKETVLEYVQNFSSCFSSFEWNQIITAGSDDEVLTEFYRYWYLKEAYVKAMGIGLAFGLHKVEFYHTSWTNISVKVDGVLNPQWRFWLSDLGKGHWVAVARGHPRTASESYKRSLKQTEFNEEEYNKGLLQPNARFVFRTVEELFSVVQKAKCSC